MIKNPKIDSALHILKGAVQKVLGAELTTNVYEEGNKGRLTVEFNKKPSIEETKEIEDQTNNKIKENLLIETIEIERNEAEKKFGSIIYDKFPVPKHIKKLKIIKINDWNVNCCIGNHVKFTSEIGKLKVNKIRFRNTRNELEISFSVE